jgi:hypothetical protein
MLRRLTALALVIAALTAVASTSAQAQLVTHPRCKSLQCRATSQLTNYKHARYVCNRGGGYNKWWSCKAERWLWHEYQRTYAVLHRASPTTVRHYALWMCIYRHEASTAPGRWYNRDTGHNGHYGGLQMHYNWGYGIVGYAYNYSAAQQMAAAERGYAANGYSHTWLIGQWAHYDCLAYA